MEEILLRYFEGHATDEERQKVEEFRKSNEAEYKLLARIWQEKGALQWQEFDKKAAYAKLQNQIEAKQGAKVRRMFFFRAAAAAVLLLVAFSLTWFYWEPTPELLEAYGGQQKSVTLADSSQIWLNKNAKLRYPEEFSDKQIREVYLEGEAFFDVAKNPDKPFIIHSEAAEVKVLGTSFNVKTAKNEALVSVATGLVEVRPAQSTEKVQVKPNFAAQVNGTQIHTAAALPNFQAWRTGKFDFQNVPIQEAISQLNTYYDKQIPVPDSALTCDINASFERASIEEVKETLKLLCNYTF